jgi:hypothetical protein
MLSASQAFPKDQKRPGWALDGAANLNDLSNVYFPEKKRLSPYGPKSLVLQESRDRLSRMDRVRGMVFLNATIRRACVSERNLLTKLSV